MTISMTRRHPATKETTGLLRGDGKRPDGLTLVPWQSGQCLTWDTTVVDTFASSYVASTSSTPGAAAEAAATRKLSKYSTSRQIHIFTTVALDSMGSINAEGLRFLHQLGDRLDSVSGDPRESSFLFQRLSVLVERFNMVAFRTWHFQFLDGHGRLATRDLFLTLAFNLRDLYYRG